MTILKIIKSIYLEDEIKIKKDIAKMRILNTVLAFSILFFFVLIEKIPLEFMFFLMSVFTDYSVILYLAIIAVLSITYGMFEKNWEPSVSIIIILLAQVMFINMFADKYVLDEEIQTLNAGKHNKPKIHYSDTWNFG